MKILKFKKIDSTNTYVKKNLTEINDKTVVIADLQTAGRGRFNRVWHDVGSQNIYLTFALKPSNKLEIVYSNLTQYLCVVLCRLLEDEFNLNPKIKWPNDILINDKKVCGILAESVIKNNTLIGIALGIGINLNCNQEIMDKIDRPATSINLVINKNIDKQAFEKKLIDNFFQNYDEFLQYGFPIIKDFYTKRAAFLNENMNIAVFNKVIRGKVLGFDDCANIIIKNEDGNIQNLNMGEFI